MVKEYKYYLFDIDRTLWAFDLNAKNAIFYLIDKFDLAGKIGATDKELFFQRYEEINKILWQRYERGEITKETLRSLRFSETFMLFCKENDRYTTFGDSTEEQEANITSFSQIFGEEYLERMIYETALEPNALKVLETLKARGCKIAVISNGFKEVQYRKLRNSGIIGYIDAFFISEEVGIHKPCPVIFKRALEALCGKEEYAIKENRPGIKSQALMIGDDFSNDIEGAQIYGIDQFYYNPYHKPCDGGPTYESDNLIDLIS
ncbi:MAG: HAD-IA family hydrolase [Bacteroidales bacterium]|nr:HAD-IA family hydrolase [Bacteroidales bacterium]